MKKEGIARRLSALGVIICMAAWLAGCGGWTAQRPAVIEVVDVVATSQTSVLVTFSGAVGKGAEVATNYRITAEGGGRLLVKGAVKREANAVLLSTAAQDPNLDYSLEVTGVEPAEGGSLTTAASKFGGSAEHAPIVATAIALNNTQVLVSFASPPNGKPEEMDRSALDPRYYDITEPNPIYHETPDLTIRSIGWAGDQTAVILDTESQQDVEYTLRITNVVSRAGDKLLDPANSTVKFRGIPANDDEGPCVVGAVSTSNTTIVVYFSEQLTVPSDNPSFYTIHVEGTNETLPLDDNGQDNVVFNEPARTQVTLTTLPQADETVSYTVTVTGVQDMQGNRIQATCDTSEGFAGISRRGPIDGDATPPRVSNVASTGNDRILVTFSEPVLTEGAEDPGHYRIYADHLAASQDGISTQSTLIVQKARLLEDRTTVELTTMAQSAIPYTMEVVSVKDLAGNQIAPPSRDLYPSSLSFFGTPVGGTPPDSDCDGLSDAEEQYGWIVTVSLLSGETQQREVTSDPGVFSAEESCEADADFNAVFQDTDQDGIPDAVEKHYRTDPRNADTDDDQLTDNRELNDIYSDPTRQDSDSDGLSDGLEFDFFKTSPLFADTDGDQFPDGDEVVTQNRNALVADMPDFEIDVVGDVQLGLDVRFTAESGTTSRTLESLSSSASLTTSDSRTVGASNADSTEWFINAGAEVGFGYDDGFTFDATVKVDGGYKESTTATFTEESVRATQREQADSRTTDEELARDETVTREVVGASMAVSVEVVNRSDLAFTIDNMEILAKVQDPRDPSRFVPIATLTSDTAVSVNLGPAPFSRGPFRFTADNPPPQLIESLRENPRGLVFEVVNYDVVDEFGRNFSFTAQDVNDRTATLSIDYNGFEPLEVQRVATHGTFDGDGDSNGLTMRAALEDVLGLEFVPEQEDESLISCLNDLTVPGDDDCSAADRARIDSSYSTRLEGGELVLWRVRSVVSDPGSAYKWFVVLDLPFGTVEPSDFNELTVKSGGYFRFIYGQDIDGDGLSAREEGLYGSLDTELDSDGDGVTDYDEVRGLWRIQLQGQPVHNTSSSPARFDTDLDGLTDCQELGRCDIYVYLFADPASADPLADQEAAKADRSSRPGLYFDEDGRPTRASSVAPAWTIRLPEDGIVDPGVTDTDGDGLTDYQEIVGFAYLPLDGAIGDPAVSVWPGDNDGEFATDPLNDDTDGDGLNDGDEVRIGTNPNSDDHDEVLDNDGDGLVNLEETQGWSVTVEWADGAQSTDALSSDPNDPDSDDDGLSDREERDLATNPQSADTDADGLDDLAELSGVPFAPDAGNPVRYTDPLDADSDDDGRTDGLEVGQAWTVNVLGQAPYSATSDPLSPDADLDGLLDGEEAVRGTNPNLPNGWDTDDDGVSDYREVMVSRGGYRTNPLTPDQVVSFEYANMTVLGGCPVQEVAEEDLQGIINSSFKGILKLERPDGSAVTLVNLDGLADNISQGTTVGFNAGETFVLSEQAGFRVFSGPLEAGFEYTGAFADLFDMDYQKTNDLGSYSEGYDYPARSGNYNQTLSGPYEGSDTYDQQCEISISWLIRVIE